MECIWSSNSASPQLSIQASDLLKGTQVLHLNWKASERMLIKHALDYTPAWGLTGAEHSTSSSCSLNFSLLPSDWLSGSLLRVHQLPQAKSTQEDFYQQRQLNSCVHRQSDLLTKTEPQISVWVPESLNSELVGHPEVFLPTWTKTQTKFSLAWKLKVSEKHQAGSTNSQHEMHTLATLTGREKDMRQSTMRQDQE